MSDLKVYGVFHGVVYGDGSVVSRGKGNVPAQQKAYVTQHNQWNPKNPCEYAEFVLVPKDVFDNLVEDGAIIVPEDK